MLLFYIELILDTFSFDTQKQLPTKKVNVNENENENDK